MTSIAAHIAGLKPGMVHTLVGVPVAEVMAQAGRAALDDPGMQVLRLDLAPDAGVELAFAEMIQALRVLVDGAVVEVPPPLRGWWQASARDPSRPPPRPFSKDRLVAWLAACIAPRRLVLLAELPLAAPERAAVLIHLLKRLVSPAIAALCVTPYLPGEVPPFDWLAHGAVVWAPPVVAPDVQAGALSLTVLSSGTPAAGSVVEQKIHHLVMADAELRGRFVFNSVVPLHGETFLPKPDLLCAAARLVVELDGFADHGQREAFLADRRRDYLFAAAGYLVLRIPNEDVLADPALVIEKIRTVMRLRLTARTGGFDDRRA
jgi:very-short-patch-repair endonuclease